MALTRKFLTALGIEADKVDEIITAHAETVEALKKERDDYKASVESAATLKKEKAEVQKELDKLKEEVAGNGDKDKDYEALKKEYEDYKAEQERKESHAVKEKAFREILKDAEIDEKYIEKVIKYSDIDGLELDDKGSVKDAKDRIKSVKAEWPEYIAVKQTQGTQTATPPTNTGGMIARPSRASQIAARYQAEHYGTLINDKGGNENVI